MAAIDKALAAATCALLGSAAPAHAQQIDLWEIDTGLLYYGESDDRVQDVSLNVVATRDFEDERVLGLSLSVDTLTGASASGATALDRPQTFTSPSGNATYTTAPGEVPLDDTFLDTRVAIGASWSQPLNRDFAVSTGFSASTEYDYLHLGLNAGLTRDFNQRNTSLALALALAQDTWDPVGGAPVGLSRMLDVDDQTNKRGDDTKDIADVLVGVTQVINANMIAQLNYSFSNASGYLNDPYKIISVVDAVTGDTLTNVSADGPDGVYLYESRPDKRTKHSVFARSKINFGGNVADLSYRFMTDDWDITSHTLEGRYRIALGEGSYFEPHLRYYMQSEADFYRASLVDSQPLPSFASSDFRLGDFDAWTVGAKFARTTRRGDEWSVRLEYYLQTGDVPADQIVGNQASREQYPDLSAVIAQFSYKFGF